MGLFIEKTELVRLRNRIDRDEGTAGRLWRALQERTMRHTQSPGIVQAIDTQEWWHLVWERLGDAAFVQAARPDERLGAWLKAVVLDLCGRAGDVWIGPRFRPRLSPPMGTLETSHTAVAVATVIDLCPELFGWKELDDVKSALRSKGMEPLRRSIIGYLDRRDHISSWFMVVLNGYGTAAAVLDDEEGTAEAAKWYEIATALYNEDSYGESQQYSNYATLHLSHLREMLIRCGAAAEAELDIGCYARLMPWYAASFLYMKPLEGWEEGDYPRSVNFGDSSALFRPSGDVLLHVAACAKTRYPACAGLARWLFERTYADPRHGPEEGASFGYYNDFQFLSLLYYEHAAEALTPEQAGLPPLCAFESGTIVARDRWERPLTVLAVQAGFQPLNVDAHRHDDQLSFILAHKQERFIADPGHCCYRLGTYGISRAASSHSTWSFEAKRDDDEPYPIEQRPVSGNLFMPARRFTRNRIVWRSAAVHIIRADAAELYGGPIRKAERTWIAAMPHVLFIVDRIEADRPVRMRSRFVFNNRDNRLVADIDAENKLVFRRNGAGMTLCQAGAVSDGEDNRHELTLDWGYMHDGYNPLPNRKGQGAEGSASIFCYTSEQYRTEHTVVYALAMDGSDSIRQWRMAALSERHWQVLPPSGAGGYSLEMKEAGELAVRCPDGGSEYRIGAEGVTVLSDAQTK